jgi:hypothetical protein
MPCKAFFYSRGREAAGMTSEERRAGRRQRRKAAREAKRCTAQYDDFARVADFDNLYRAFLDARRGVSWKESVQRYEANALRNTAEARRKLLTGESVQCGFAEFTLHERGKIRHIKSVHISERIVQKCLCDQALVPLLSNGLIYDNGASVKGKGVHFALRRFVAHLSKFYRTNGSNDGYALTVDFAKYFDNVDHATLFGLLDRKIRDKRIKELTKRFVSVFGQGKSLGLGSQVSQICAIFYPDTLDHLIKDRWEIKYYGRYMDDLYVIHHSKAYLMQCLKELKQACEKLKITINEKKTRIIKLSHGVDFLKGRYRLLPSGRVVRLPGKDTTTRMRRKLKKFRKLIDEKKMSFNDVRTSYQSWRGNYKRRFTAYYRVKYMDKVFNRLLVFDHKEKKHERSVSGKKRRKDHIPHGCGRDGTD